MLKPNIQLFAEQKDEPEDPKNTNPKGQPPAEPPKDNDQKPPNNDGKTVTMTQQELDKLISNRISRALKHAGENPNDNGQPDPNGNSLTDTPSTQPDNSELFAAQQELIQARAQLAALKSNVSPDAVEDAVVLAMRDVEKGGNEPTDENVSEAIKNVLKRHPEWAKDDEKKHGGFKVGTNTGDNGGEKTPLHSGTVIL